jgi:hypothetical protein
MGGVIAGAREAIARRCFFAGAAQGSAFTHFFLAKRCNKTCTSSPPGPAAQNRHGVLEPPPRPPPHTSRTAVNTQWYRQTPLPIENCTWQDLPRARRECIALARVNRSQRASAATRARSSETGCMRRLQPHMLHQHQRAERWLQGCSHRCPRTGIAAACCSMLHAYVKHAETRCTAKNTAAVLRCRSNGQKDE